MDAFLPLWRLITSLDGNAFLSALIGGALALAGVFWAARLERRARQEEAASLFQRDTLMALQDAIESHVRSTQQIEYWRQRPANMEKSRREALGELFGTPQGDALLPPPTPMDTVKHMESLWPHVQEWHESRYVTQRLASRVDNEAVRTNVGALIDAARPVITESVMEKSNEINDKLNAEIGLLIRRGATTKQGFAAEGGES